MSKDIVSVRIEHDKGSQVMPVQGLFIKIRDRIMHGGHDGQILGVFGTKRLLLDEDGFVFVQDQGPSGLMNVGLLQAGSPTIIIVGTRGMIREMQVLDLADAARVYKTPDWACLRSAMFKEVMRGLFIVPGKIS